MPFLFQDLFGLVLGTALAPLLMLLPGLGLARFAMPEGRGWQAIGWGMLLALALLPIVDALVIRMSGMAGMVGLHAGIALYGLPLLRGLPWRGALPVVALALCWWLICAWSFVDIDWNGRLNQSLLIFDLVKHAAVTEQIAQEGVPFHDPFFARYGFAGYYYYYYSWPAAVRWLSSFEISARMAFAACAFWTGIAVPTLLWRIATDAGLIRAGHGRRALLTAGLLCFATGADLLPLLLRWSITGHADPHIDMWNTEVTWLLRSTLWVPHHLAAMIAGWVGLLIAARATASPRGWGLAMLAGLAFASMFGLSAWVALALAPVLAGWGLIRLRHRDLRLVVAGLIAALCSLPQLADLLHGRASEGQAVALGVRVFMGLAPGDGLSAQLIYLALLPLNYALEFGIFALGTCLAWSMHRRYPAKQEADETRVCRLVLWAAVGSLIVASFFKSTLINNDLGWRSILFAQSAAMVATIHVAQHREAWQRHARLAGALLLLGWLGTAYDVIALRLTSQPWMSTGVMTLNRDPALDHALREAYSWADAHLPEDATLQHDPSSSRRAFDFGLYGRHWPAVADREAQLFGAPPAAVMARIAWLKPVFAVSMNPVNIARRTSATGVDYLLFTRQDRVWPHLPLPCIYRSAQICIAAAPLEKRR